MEPHPYRLAFEARDHHGMVELLADDVVFHSPVITGPGFEGRDSVAALLEIVLREITDEEYIHEFGDDRTRILVANARVLGKPIKATTLLEHDAEGKIREIWVMARPLVGVVAIAEAIGSGLAGREKPGRRRVVRAVSKPLAGFAAITNRAGSRIIASLNRDTAKG
jgi:hypothetical protein